MLSRSLGSEYVCSLLLKTTNRNQTCRNGRVSTHSDVQRGSANRQTSFSGRGNAWKKLSFLGHIAKKFRRPTILQLNIEGLTESKMNVFYYLALQSEALVILLQKTHCTDAEMLVLSTNWVFFKQEAWPCHVFPRATKVHAFGPISTDIGDRVLCVDVNAYKIVNVYKPPPTRLRSLDLPVFPHPVFMLEILTVVMLNWVTMITVRSVSAWLAGQVLIVLPSYIMPRTLPVFTPAAGTLASTRI